MHLGTSSQGEARLPAVDLQRARAWYSEKLGLDPVERRDGGLRYQLGSSSFCLFSSAGQSDGGFTQLALTVSDIESTVATLKSRGVVFETESSTGMPMTNDIVEIDDNYPSKGSGEKGAFFRDSEGNMLALAQTTGPARSSRIRGVSVLLGSRDPGRLRVFYSEAFDVTADSDGWLRIGDVGLLCDDRPELGTATQEPARSILTVEVTDAARVVDRLDRMGVQWLVPLEERPDGLFSTALDPDGNIFQVIQLSDGYHARQTP